MSRCTGILPSHSLFLCLISDGQEHSALSVLKKFSATALSQQFLFRLMLCFTCGSAFRSIANSAQAY